MNFPYTFDPETTKHYLDRIEKLTHETQPEWGKMNVGQMLAHLSVAYDMDNGTITERPGWFGRLMINLFVKKMVINDKPYKKNLRTAPVFLMTDKKDFEKEKKKLIAHIKYVDEKGEAYYEGRENLSFGPLTAKEWSNVFSKHLHHHLSQFGV